MQEVLLLTEMGKEKNSNSFRSYSLSRAGSNFRANIVQIFNIEYLLLLEDITDIGLN